MKSLRNLALVSLFGVSTLLTGCFEDVAGGTSGSTPTITETRLESTNLIAGGGATNIRGVVSDDNTGISLSLKVLSSTNTDVTTGFTITYVAVTNSDKTWSIGSPDQGNGLIAAKTGTAAGTYTLVYTATDASNATGTANVTFTVGGGGSTGGTATTQDTGSVSNVNGPNKGAYDFIGKAGVSSSAAPTTKDLKDITAIGEVFDGSLSSGNGATFVKANSFDFDNATTTSIATAFAAGTAGTQILLPAVGDIWLVKTTRSGVDTYVAVKFTVVHKESTTSSANDGYVKFSFRK